MLARLVRDRYDYLLTDIPVYSRKKRLVGEIDLLGVKDNECDVFEVKCSHRIHKARRQLTKVRKNYAGHKVNRTFFFCGASRALITV